MAGALDMDRVKAPLVIGVTGHRDLREEDRESLEKSVRKVFIELRGQYPRTPLIVLSPLAEGADQLVARVALLPEIGARLIVPLPMPKLMYEADFSEKPLKEFNRLLSLADQWFEIPLVADAAVVGHAGPERDLQYEAVGKYIARESQILLALWDGLQLGKVGGTSEIVKFQTEGLPARRACNLLPPELFPVYHIVTPRQSNPSPQKAFEVHTIYPPAFGSRKKAKQYYEKTFGNLDGFNGLAEECGAALHERIPTKDVQNFSRGEIWMLHRYTVVDALAVRFYKRTLLADQALHWLVFASFSSFVLFAHMPENPRLALALALLFLACGYGLHWMAKHKALDEKRLDYRAMAEGCRVNLFWLLANVRESVAENYLGKQRSELDWIRNGLRGWDIGLHHHSPTSWNDPKIRLHFVLNHWVLDQYKYFKRAVKKSERSAELMERLVTACLAVAILVGLGLFIATLTIGWPPAKEPEPEWLVACIVAIDVFLAGAALLHHANERMAHSEHLKQYRRMLNIFENGAKSIQGLLNAGNLAAARTCIRALGKEALIENGDWVLLHRERPLEIPHP